MDVAKLKEEKRAVDEALEKVDTTNKTLNVRLKKSYERIQELDKEIESANSDRDFLRKEVDEANSRVKVLEAWCKETKFTVKLMMVTTMILISLIRTVAKIPEI